ncbi:MAG: 4Fe-4S binding protein [Acidobacteria bacterium]|nr:4Fe-4S binding protein [Acidobacteriota bacterium]
MKRKIIAIDQEKCNGCGLCASGCPEGALKIIDGKARLVGDLLCDGLGACLQTCPENAISIEEREAEPYNEITALENIIPQGQNVLKAHLEHLSSHGQTTYLNQALSYLREHQIPFDLSQEAPAAHSIPRHCPGSQSMAFPSRQGSEENGEARPSRLMHWPIQLHLISPAAPHYRNSDLLIAADCVAFSLGDFHRDFLKGRTLAIACPKLDTRQEVYTEKLTAMIDQAGLKSISVLIMQVPCCNGLLRLVREAASRAAHKVPIRCVVVGIRGEILSDSPVDIESGTSGKTGSLTGEPLKAVGTASIKEGSIGMFS